MKAQNSEAGPEYRHPIVWGCADARFGFGLLSDSRRASRIVEGSQRCLSPMYEDLYLLYTPSMMRTETRPSLGPKPALSCTPIALCGVSSAALEFVIFIFCTSGCW